MDMHENMQATAESSPQQCILEHQQQSSQKAKDLQDIMQARIPVHARSAVVIGKVSDHYSTNHLELTRNALAIESPTLCKKPSVGSLCRLHSVADTWTRLWSDMYCRC